ncbi:MAG: phenylalanine--tRNA ligase subunit beta [Kofleriaceae bacterium]
MKILWNWLLELCDFDRQPTPAEGAAALTRGGIEVETLTELGRELRGVVVAEVVAKRPHPKSDKLTLVQVRTERDGAATEVVCGAPNVPEPGRKVIWAQVGGTLPGGITLAPKEVKGVLSPGMLCSETELGLGDDGDGIIVLAAEDDVALGTPAAQALGLDDWLFELSTHANRGDLLGHLGVARELCALLGGRLVWPQADLGGVTAGEPHVLAVSIADAADCPRYTARVIEGLTVGPSPRKLQQRLRNLGARPVSNLVDVTNLVMFELGQPLHAFDAATLKRGALAVRAARAGETLVTLDDQTRELTPADLLICDGDEPVALAGVMGGRDTEVTAATRAVVLESASFLSAKVRRTGRRLGLSSEAAQRYERGVDPELAAFASARAAFLLAQLGGGVVRPGLADAYPGRREAAPIAVRVARVAHIAGYAISAADCRRALEALGFGCVVAGEGLSVTPPSARADVHREIDVIEEIIRLHGFEHVPATLPRLREAPKGGGESVADRARARLAAAGLAEAITFGFCARERVAALRLDPADRRGSPIALRNPMSEAQAVMRTSLLPNLLAAVARNHSFGHRDVALFEVGSVFLRRGGPGEGDLTELADEPQLAAGVLCGARAAQLGRGARYDVFDAKGLALAALGAIAGDVEVTASATSAVPYLHPGVAGELRVAGAVVGHFGEVHPETRRALGVDAPVFAFELALDALPAATPAKMRPIPRFPGATRDVSLLMAAAQPASAVAELIAAAAEPLVAGVHVLEDYRDDKLGEGRKSMLWSIDYRAADRTLTDAEIDAAHERIVGKLVEGLPAQRR